MKTLIVAHGILQVNRKLLLDRDQLERAAQAGDPEATIAPLRINDDSSLSLLSPYEYIYARYDKSPKLQVRASC